MARVQHVKKAQQRYYTVPVIDPETGEQKQTPVMDKRTGKQKVSKRGPVFLRVTKEDRTRPKPLLECDFPGCTINDRKIAVGSPYQYIVIKTSSYSSTQKNRHAEHPAWNIWEYSSSTSARVAQVQSEGADIIENFEFSSYDDFDDLKSQVAELAGELRDEKQESLDNMPDGLRDGSELNEIVDAMESWVDEIEDADEPDRPEPEPTTKWHAVGPDEQDLNEEGYDDEAEAQQELDNYLEEHPDEDPDEWDVEEREHDDETSDEDEVDEDWVEEAKQAVQDALDSYEG